MNKFGQAKFVEFLAELFVNDKLENILKTNEKNNFKSRNTEDIYMKFSYSGEKRVEPDTQVIVPAYCYIILVCFFIVYPNAMSGFQYHLSG